MTTSAHPSVDRSSWLRRWHRQQERYLPERDRRFTVMLDYVERARGDGALRFLDLCCGPGSLAEDLHLPNPVIRSHYGHGFIKPYVRDHLLLRTEAATNNVTDYAVPKAVDHLPQLRPKLSAIVDTYLDVQQDILETFVDRGQLRAVGQPTVLPTSKRVPGLKLDHPRQLAVMHALVAFSHIAAGSTFTTAELHTRAVAALSVALSLAPEHYRLSSLRYDLSKLRRRASSRSCRTPGGTGCCPRAIASASSFSNSLNASTLRSPPGSCSPCGAMRPFTTSACRSSTRSTSTSSRRSIAFSRASVSKPRSRREQRERNSRYVPYNGLGEVPGGQLGHALGEEGAIDRR